MPNELNETLLQLQKRILELEAREAKRNALPRKLACMMHTIRHKRTMILVASALLAVGTAAYVYAAGPAALTIFSSGTPIRADEVNTNFSNLNDQLGKMDSSHWSYTAGSPNTIGYTGGMLGIGTAAPVHKLDVLETRDNLYAARIQSTGASGHGLAFNTPGNSYVMGFFTTGTPSVNVGSITQNGSRTYFNETSDRRLKDNIVDTHLSLDDLMDVRVRDFNFKSDPEAKRQTGFIAQELYEIYPDAVSKPVKESDIWGVDYGKLTPLLVKAIQDQQRKIDNLSAENAELKARIDVIAAKLGL